MKSAAVAVFVLLFAAGTHAQRRHGGPPPAPSVPPILSTGGPTTLPPPPPPSPFAARPRTYAPHYDRPAPVHGRRGYGAGVPIYGDAIGFGAYVTGPAPATSPVPEQNLPPSAPPPELPGTSALVPEPPKETAVHGPDTFYLIPGCYAGNRPPNPGRLPKGCDVSKLRSMPVR